MGKTGPEMDNSARMFETPRKFKTPEAHKTAISTTSTTQEMVQHPQFPAEPKGIQKGDNMTRQERNRPTTIEKIQGDKKNGKR